MSTETDHISSDHLTDLQFIERFEDCTLPAAWFHHRDHIRMAWLQIKKHGLLNALDKISAGIKRYAAAQGKAERYHETITWAYAILINERIARANPEQTWTEFVAVNGDLLDWERNILRKYYHPATLSTELSKTTFLLPDKTVTADSGATRF